MPRLTVVLFAALLPLAGAMPAAAQEIPDLTAARDLLLPCQEADNDPRDGFIAQLECVQFIRGFLAGAEAAGGLEPALCLPEANTDDMMRRAIVRWVHGSFSRRSKLPVGEALHAALSDGFACG